MPQKCLVLFLIIVYTTNIKTDKGGFYAISDCKK